MRVDHTTFNFRRAAAIGAGKLAGRASKLLGKGGGTALPGLVAVRLAPRLVHDLGSQIPLGNIIVSGTNGKTTTARMLAGILSDAGYRPVRNESGSNLMRGVATSFVREANISGNLSLDDNRIGLFETDEAALPGVVRELDPDFLLLLNLFRDQLDRYGEVATISRIWASAVKNLRVSTQIIANADDPLIADVVSGRENVCYFSVESATGPAVRPVHVSDVKGCPRCGGQIQYDSLFLGHMGDYVCASCGLRRPNAAVTARDVTLLGVSGSKFELVTKTASEEVRLPLPGMYNVYNALAAAALADTAGIETSCVVRALSNVTPAFGRMERLTIGSRTVVLALAKNPTGLNEVLRTLIAGGQELNLVVMLNDNTADGRDVSWIWDADVESLVGHVSAVIFGGTRAEDMALRFKYANVLPASTMTWEIQHNTEMCVNRALQLTPQGGTLFIVPTYTALLDVRNTLARLGHVRPYWEE